MVEQHPGHHLQLHEVLGGRPAHLEARTAGPGFPEGKIVIRRWSRAEIIRTNLSAFVFFLLTMCSILPAVKSLVLEKRRTQMSLESRAASCELNLHCDMYTPPPGLRLTVDAATVGMNLCPSRGDSPAPATTSRPVSFLQVDSRSPGGTPYSAYPNPLSTIRHLGSLLACSVCMMPVLRFSVLSTPRRITKSSPTPTVNTKLSVRRAASRLRRPAKRETERAVRNLKTKQVGRRMVN